MELISPDEECALWTQDYTLDFDNWQRAQLLGAPIVYKGSQMSVLVSKSYLECWK